MSARRPAPASPAGTLKLRLTIAYDGARYAGWQVQQTGVGVQQRVEEALARIFPTGPRLHSASRTDTGVHALGMVAHFEVPVAEFRLPLAKVPLALNAHLPPDIRVMAAGRCRAEFHARFTATGKQYRYFVWNHPAMNPLWAGRAWHVPRPLNRQAMRLAARAFVGRHDFRSFAANRGYEPTSTIRTVRRCELRSQGPLLVWIIEADGFLYKMCRGLVGTLVQVGLGKIPAGSLTQILRRRDRRVAGMSAPAHGLVLWKVFYPSRTGPRRSGGSSVSARLGAPAKPEA